jgi:hypothetical protein
VHSHDATSSPPAIATSSAEYARFPVCRSCTSRTASTRSSACQRPSEHRGSRPPRGRRTCRRVNESGTAACPSPSRNACCGRAAIGMSRVSPSSLCACCRYTSPHAYGSKEGGAREAMGPSDTRFQDEPSDIWNCRGRRSVCPWQLLFGDMRCRRSIHPSIHPAPIPFFCSPFRYFTAYWRG